MIKMKLSRFDVPFFLSGGFWNFFVVFFSAGEGVAAAGDAAAAAGDAAAAP